MKSYLWLLVLMACGPRQKPDLPGDAWEKPPQAHLDSLSTVWRHDSTGCLGFRDYQNAKMLIRSYELVGKGPKETLDIFGKPNHVHQRNPQETTFRYFIGCPRADGCVYEMLLMTFRSDSLISFKAPILD